MDELPCLNQYRNISFLPIATEGQVFAASGQQMICSLSSPLKIQNRFSQRMIMSHESKTKGQAQVSISGLEARRCYICAGVYGIYP